VSIVLVKNCLSFSAMYITIILNTTATNYNTFIKYIGGAIVVITSKPIFDFHSNLDLLIAFFIQGTMEEKIYDRQVRNIAYCILNLRRILDT
jgi:hypothetical protein